MPSIVAASRRLNLTTKDGRKLLEASPQRWQDEAWAYFGVLPEVAFAANFMGNAMGRVRWFPGVVLNPDEPAVPLEDVEGLPEGMAEAAREELDRITNDRDGMTGIKRSLGINLSIAGEAYLVGRPKDDDEDDSGGDAGDDSAEDWGVYSSAALKPKGDKVFLQEAPNSKKKIELPDDTLVYRIWRRDPQWPALAWSNMKASLDTAEELLLHSKTLRAIAKSGTNAGVFLVPSEIDPPKMARADADNPDQFDPDAVGEGDQETELVRNFIEFCTTAVEDDGSAGQVAPWLLKAAYDFLDRVRHIQFARPIDDNLVARIEHLIERLAHGLDLPAEILKGIGEANHWTSWLISDETYKAHIQPTDSIAAQGVAYSILRPALIDRKFPRDQVARVVLGQDPSALVVRPNRSQDAKDAHDRWAISDATLRGSLGFSDTDAPDDDELTRRYALRRGPGAPDMTARLFEDTGLVGDDVLPENVGTSGPSSSSGGDTSSDGDPMEGGDTIPATLPEGGEPAMRSITAASPPSDVEALLASLEPRLRERLTAAASQAVTEALRKAGTRLRGAAQGHDQLRERVNGQPPEQVGIILGPLVAAELADLETLLDGSFDQLADQWNTWVSQAQDSIASTLGRHVDDAPNPSQARAAVEQYQTQAEADRDAGWVVFAGLILELTRDRLFRGAEDLAEGEFDPSVSAPQGIARQALARAGGQVGLSPAGVATVGAVAGLTIGPRVLDLLAGLGLQVERWRWVTGVPAHPFEPHQRLDGVEVSQPDDPQLANPGRFPPVGFLRPGDHRGCQCDLIPLVGIAAQEEAA